MLDQFRRECLKMNAIDVFSEVVERRPGMTEQQRPSTAFSGFYFIGGLQIDKYCPRLNSWKHVKRAIISETLFHAGLVLHESRLIIVGGLRSPDDVGSNTVNIPYLSMFYKRLNEVIDRVSKFAYNTSRLFKGFQHRFALL